MNYQVGDFVIRLKNASLARRRTVLTAFSKSNKAMAEILLKEGFLSRVKQEEQDGKKIFSLTLAYEDRSPVMTGVLLFSKPSLRVYQKLKNIKNVKKRALGVEVLSTSKGLMTAAEAKKKGVGGELLFRIW